MRGQGRVYLQPGSGKWWLDYTLDGHRHREPSHTTVKREALDLLRQRIGDRQTGKIIGTPDKVTFALLSAALKRRYSHAGHRSLKRAEQALAHLEAFFGANRRAVAISKHEVGAYIEQRRATRARATVAYEVAVLNSAFGAAVDEGLLAVRPAFKLPAVKNVRECWFSVAELDALLALLPEHLQAPVEFATLTGWRRENVFGLTWEHVDFGRGEIRAPIGTTKNGEPILVPFNVKSRLNGLLRERQRATQGRGPVFNGAGLRDAWEKAVGPEGLDKWGEQYDPDTNAVQKVRPRFHDLRHTFAQHMVDSGADQRTIMEAGGWKTDSAFARYHVRTTEAKRAAATKHQDYLEAERARAKQERRLVMAPHAQRTA